MLALADLKGKSEKVIKAHLAKSYSGTNHGYSGTNGDAKQVREAKKLLKPMSVLVAYESVGDYGCDSSSYFMMFNKETKKLFEIHGSHCSCYGFEGQLELEETNVTALKARAKIGRVFSCGGYDRDETDNQKTVNQFVNGLKMSSL